MAPDGVDPAAGHATVLVVDDDEDLRQVVADELRGAGYRVLAAEDGAQALRHLKDAAVDLVLTDMVMPGMSGTDLLHEVHAVAPGLPVLVCTAFATIGGAVSAVKSGAHHYLAKPFTPLELRGAVSEALSESHLTEHLNRLAAEAEELGFVAHAVSMRRVLSFLDRAAASDAPVVITGESGTGKDRLARLLHARSPRRDGAFVGVNCAAIPESLIESQLFGHRRGAFTDARQDMPGFFQQADGGTLFLDEIGDMPLLLQAKLLRALQEREVQPLGAHSPLKLDFRVVVATHHDPLQLVKAGTFREDLFYRLCAVRVHVPPLRDRPDDLLPLVAFIMKAHGKRDDGTIPSVSAAALTSLKAHSWPGNVRELENILRGALVADQDGVIGLDDLPEPLRTRPRPGPLDAGARSMADIERAHVLKTLQEAGNNKKRAAQMLGMDRKTLYRKLELYRDSKQ